jgi:hypothetical protein
VVFHVGLGVTWDEGRTFTLLGVDGFQTFYALNDCEDIGPTVSSDALFVDVGIGDVSTFTCPVKARYWQDGICNSQDVPMDGLLD